MHDEHGHEIQDGSTHTARLAEWQWDTTTDGDIYLSVVARITEGPFTGLALRGRMYFDRDKADKYGRTAADRSMEALRAAGLQGDLDTVDANTGGLDAGNVSVVVERKHGNDGNTYVNAKFINAPRGATIKTFAPPPPEARRAFFAAMKQHEAAAGRASTAAKPAQRPAPAARPAQQQPAQQGVRDDDIPF